MDVGGTVEAPANPEKNGYDFAGWKNGDALFDFSTPITTNITLKAEWTLHNYTITYKNVTEHENPDTYTIEDEIILKAPTKGTEPAQTIFVQWHSEETLQKPIEKIAKGTTGNKIFYAEWSDKAVYTVTFNTDGGSEVAVQRVKDGEKATKPATDPEKEGYTFKGWDFDFATPITENKTVTAKWEIKKYTVTFMNGEDEVKKTEVEYNSTIPDNEMPDTATLSSSGGEPFAGWFNGANRFDSTTHIKTDTTLNATFGISVTKNADGSYSFADGTYKAVWEGDNAIIRFKLPEEVTFAKESDYDKLRLKGTFSFGDTAQYNQLYIQTVGNGDNALFGWNMIVDWTNGLSGEKKYAVSNIISNDITASDCKFVTSGYKEGVTEGETEISITIKDVTLSYDKYDASVGVVLFDPAKDWTGETTEIDGETYAVSVALGYGKPFVEFSDIDFTKFSIIKAKACAKNPNENYQLTINFAGGDSWTDVCSIYFYKPLVAEPQEKEANIETLKQNTAKLIRLIVQDASQKDYPSVEDEVVHIGKIIATVK